MIDWTASVRGLTIGAGTVFGFNLPEGFGLPDVRSGDLDLPRQDGLLAGDDFLTGRRLVFEVELDALSAVAAEDALIELKTAFAPSREDIELTFRLTGSPVEYRVVGRPRGCLVGLTNLFGIASLASARCEFMCTDPRLYGSEISTVISLPSGTAGLTFAATAAFSFGSTTGGEAVLTNSGTYETDWTATFTGPLTGPQLEHVELGRTLAFTTLTVAAGETLVLDSRTKAALLNGTASRYSSLASASRWWTLTPGNSTIRLRAASGSGNVEVRHSPAYV